MEMMTGARPPEARGIVQQTTFMEEGGPKKRRRFAPTDPADVRGWGTRQATIPATRPDWHELQPRARQVYTAIEGACPPRESDGWRVGRAIKRKVIAAETGQSLRTVKRAIDELVAAGWIRVSKDGGRVGRAQSYVVLKHLDPSGDRDPFGPMPFEVWQPWESKAYAAAVARNAERRARIKAAEAAHVSALEAGDAEAAREAFMLARSLRAEVEPQGDFFGGQGGDLTSPRCQPEGDTVSTLACHGGDLRVTRCQPEPANESTSARQFGDPILCSPLDPPNPSPPSAREPEAAEGAPAEAPSAAPEGEGGAEAFEEEEDADLVPASAGAHPLADPSCADCGGTGFVPDGACSCLCRVAERQRLAAHAAANIQSLRPHRNAEGLIASVAEMPEGAEKEEAEELLADVAESGEEAVAVASPRVAAAVAEDCRRRSWGVLAIRASMARLEDMEAAKEGRTGPVALSRAEGLDVLAVWLDEDEAHPMWRGKLAGFIDRARENKCAVVVAAPRGPEGVRRVYGPRLLEAIGGPDAWKGGPLR